MGVVDAAPHTSGSDDQKLFLSEEEDDLNQVAHEPAEDGSGGPPRKESPFIISSVVVGDEQDAGISDSDRKRHGRTLLDSRKSPLESRVQATRSSSSLWQLGSSDFAGGSCGDFYVQALSTAITPAKVCVCVYNGRRGGAVRGQNILNITVLYSAIRSMNGGLYSRVATIDPAMYKHTVG